jgi:hypothetical protein
MGNKLNMENKLDKRSFTDLLINDNGLFKVDEKKIKLDTMYRKIQYKDNFMYPNGSYDENGITKEKYLVIVSLNDKISKLYINKRKQRNNEDIYKEPIHPLLWSNLEDKDDKGNKNEYDLSSHRNSHKYEITNLNFNIKKEIYYLLSSLENLLDSNGDIDAKQIIMKAITRSPELLMYLYE